MLETIVSKERAYLMLEPGARVGVLVNNLGGSTLMEAYVVLRAALHHLTHTMQVGLPVDDAGCYASSCHAPPMTPQHLFGRSPCRTLPPLPPFLSPSLHVAHCSASACNPDVE